MKIKYWYILFLSLIILFFMKKCVEQFENGDAPENADDSENSESAENTDPSIEGPSFNMCTCNSLCKLKNVGSDDIVRNIDCSLPMKAFSGTLKKLLFIIKIIFVLYVTILLKINVELEMVKN